MGISALIDNWSLEIASSVLSPESRQPYGRENYFFDCVANIVMAIIFFDDLLYLDNGNNRFWGKSVFAEEVDGYFHGIKINEETLPKIKYPFPYADKKDFNTIISEGAIRYLYISNYLGCNYFPAPLRAEYIKSNKLSEKRVEYIFLDMIDDKVKECINYINSELGSDTFKVDVPMIFNYVLSQVDSKSSIIKTAVQIRNSKNAIALRKWLSNINDYTEAGNILAVNNEILSVKEVMNDFFKDLGMIEKTDKCEMTISFPPSVTIPLPNKILHNKKRHIIFLIDIVRNNLESRISDRMISDIFNRQW